MKKMPKSFFNKIDPSISFFVICGLLLFLILFLFDIKYMENWRDVIVEAHGLLFDLVLFGIILTSYYIKTNKKQQINRLQEEIEDYIIKSKEPAPKDN